MEKDEGFTLDCSQRLLQGSEAENSDDDEIPMEMDLTTSGPPISDDETEMEKPMDRQSQIIMVFPPLLDYRFYFVFKDRSNLLRRYERHKKWAFAIC